MPPVDLALILALDASASVTYDEFGLIAGGLAAALREPEIVDGLTGGALAASLAAVLIFSGAAAQEVMVDWTRLASAADVAAFADQVDNIPRIVKPGLTAIGAALRAAEALLQQSPAEARRRVIDIAGDGRSNDGVAPGPMRDRLAAAGVTINGLCVLHEEPDLLAYFNDEVIGGRDAFALICADYPAFAGAIAQKLKREILT